MLISSAYDDLLEQAFTLAGKPFARLSAMIRKGNKHEVGHVQVEFSDGNAAAGVYTSEQVSTLEKTLADYSIIYKMRGTCRSNGNAREALTVTESDYFSFAQNTAAILPNYLVAQLGDLGLLFVGYRPRHWEDRLLATVLLKRRQAPEPCFRLVQTGEEPLETVFWQRRSVQPYAMDVQELEQYLVGGVA
ncbi:MAG: SIR2 family protein [Candidatus Thiothrix putei]|uniref:SIR2 family protein n=1 Tax=Candidatus Thiothrix putei TaxID=3080811 RepID=A0AA95H8U0_9GAMM|nr:MAG: SIR2 family protein [Candidatus Thiothrix putei]